MGPRGTGSDDSWGLDDPIGHMGSAEAERRLKGGVSRETDPEGRLGLQGAHDAAKEGRKQDKVDGRLGRAVVRPLLDYQAEEYERLWLDFMGLTERERWELLRSWQYWKEEERHTVMLMERVKDVGIKAIDDDDIARMHLHGWRISAKRPSIQAKQLTALQKLREGSWQRECIRERGRTDAATRRVTDLERKLTKYESEFDRLLNQERARVEEETRRVVLEQMKKEFELKERVKGGVEEAFRPTEASGESTP